MTAPNKASILVLGVHPDSEAYPNVKYRLEALRRHSGYHLSEINYPIWRDARKSKGALAALIRTFWAHTYVLLSCIFRYKKINPQIIYIPYPAIFCTLLVRLCFIRRPIVLDAFISIYDTVVNDRSVLNKTSIMAKLLFAIERKAFNLAAKVMVDTWENAEFYSQLFKLPIEKFVVSPLFTSEEARAGKAVRLDSNKFNVLFVGNMIPLHGVGVILEAARLLSGEEDIQFVLIGDGQESWRVDEFVGQSNLRWIRDWVPEFEVKGAIEQADVCLGVFAGNAKSNRVCPYKLYLYNFLGKPIVTFASTWAVRQAQSTMTLIPGGDAVQLANAILELRENLGKGTTKYNNNFYQACLSNEKASVVFDTMVNELIAGYSELRRGG